MKPKIKWIAYLALLAGGFLNPLLLIFGHCLLESESALYGLVIAVWLFALYEFCTILVVENKRNTSNPRQLINTYMALKVGKILFSLLFAGIYVFAFKEESKRFVLLFVLLYFIFLLFDTLYLSFREKELKPKDKK